jgi:serine/threonine-protein kinase
MFGFTARVFASTAAIVGVVVVAALMIGSMQLRRAGEAATRRGLEQSADLVAQFLAGRERSLAGGARVFVQQPYFRTLVSERRREDLFDQSGEAVAQLEAHWVMITDRSGVLLAKSDEPRMVVDSLGGVPLVAGALRGGQTQGFGVSRDSLLFQAVGVPIIIPGQPPVGVLVATRVVDSAFAADVKAATASDLIFYARDRNGDLRVVASTLGRGVAVLAAAERLAQLPPGNEAGRTDVTIARVDYFTQGASLTTAAGDVIGGFAVLRPRDGVVTGLDGIRLSLEIAAALGLVLAMAMAFFAARQITRPLRQLSSTVLRAADGDYDATIGMHAGGGGTEVETLAIAFESLLADLRDKEALVGSVMQAWTEPASVVSAAPRRLSIVTSDATPEEASSGIDLLPGTVLADRYEIEEVLGRGGMGIVYKATDRVLGEAIAVKLLRREIVSADPHAFERFKEELRLTRRISHRHVVRTYDFGDHRGTPFVTMEFVPGSSLARIIGTRGPLPPDAIISIAKQLMRALASAHDQGVVHGDLKPHNLLITPSGVLKVTDFGVARLIRDAAPERERRSAQLREGALVARLAGAVVGTPEYMAPELLMGQPATPASDLYAAGMVLHECQTGQTPFQADTPMAFIARKLTDPPRPPILRLEPTLGSTADLEALVESMTQADPIRRIPTAVLVLERLARLG